MLARYLEGATYEQVAAAFGVDISTAWWGVQKELRRRGLVLVRPAPQVRPRDLAESAA